VASTKVLAGTKAINLVEKSGLDASELLSSGYLLPTGFQWQGFKSLGKPQISPYATQYAGVEQTASNTIKGDTDNAYSLAELIASAEAYSYGVFNVTSDFTGFTGSSYYGYKPADANATAIADTYLVTGKLKNLSLSAKAIANVGSDWAWGAQNFYLDASKNKFSVNGNIDVYGECGSGVSVDPVFGLNKSTLEFGKAEDILFIKSSANAGDFSNEAVAYGVQGGHLDADKSSASLSTAGYKNLRYAIDLGAGADTLTIEVEANNFGLNSATLIQSKQAQASKVIKDYIKDNEDKGMQRAVGVFRSTIDLGDGSDVFTSKATVSLNFSQAQVRDITNSLAGATLIAPADDLFDEDNGRFSGKTWKAAAAVDIFESVMLAGSGDDNLNIYNGWYSDIWLDSGDDTVQVSAGRDLYIHGGEGNDSVLINDSSLVQSTHASIFKSAYYDGIKNGFHEIITTEGSIYVDGDVEKISVNGKIIELPENGIPIGEAIEIDLKSSILGTSKNDKLVGSSSKDDVIVSGEGQDIMTGRKGRDTFVITDIKAADRITDFSIKDDTIAFAEGILDAYDEATITNVLSIKALQELDASDGLDEALTYVAIGKSKDFIAISPEIGVNLGINTTTKRMIYDEDGDWSTNEDQTVLVAFAKTTKLSGLKSSNFSFGAVLKA